MSDKNNNQNNLNEEETDTTAAVPAEEEYITSTDSKDLLADVIAGEKSQAEADTEAEAETDETDDGESGKKKKKKKKKEKKKRDHKKLKHGAMSTIYTVVFIVVVVLVNIIATIIFDKYPITFDLTENGKYSISEESEEYVKSIDRDVTIKIFATEDSFTAVNDYTQQANEVMKKYAKYNSHISIEYVDIDSNPDVVSEYSDQDISSYSIIVESPSLDEDGNVMTDDDGSELKRIRSVSLMDLISFTDDFEEQVSNYGMSAEDYLLAYAGDETTAFALAVSNSLVEASTADQAFVSALMAVTDPDPVSVSILTGRSEIADTSYLQKLLLANGYSVSEVNITSEEIPEDTDLCIVPAPSTDYMDAEITKLDDFISNDGDMGKNLIYIASYQQQDTPNLDEFLEEYYIEIGDGIICENDAEHYYTQSFYTIADTISDSFADDISTDDAQLIIYGSRPIKLLTDEKGMITTEAYVQSTENAYVADTSTGDALENGQQTYVAMSSKASFNDEGGADYSNILVLGSDSMVSDTFLRYNQYQNREYFLSVINGMTGKTSVGITIEPKVITGNIFDITAEQIKVLQIIFIGVIPAVTLVLGLVIWLRRKNR